MSPVKTSFYLFIYFANEVLRLNLGVCRKNYSNSQNLTHFIIEYDEEKLQILIANKYTESN